MGNPMTPIVLIARSYPQDPGPSPRNTIAHSFDNQEDGVVTNAGLAMVNLRLMAAGGIGLASSAAILAAAGAFDPATGAEDAAPGVSDVVDDVFARHDHDGDGRIALSPREYDRSVQLRENVSIGALAQIAGQDERVGASLPTPDDAGLTLPVRTDLRLLMDAAQQAIEGVTAAADQPLSLTREQLGAAIVQRFDHDDSGDLEPAERAQLEREFPTDTINFRFIRVWHEGEWTADGPIPGAPDSLPSGPVHVHPDGRIETHDR
jgi:hypothetical protein